MDDSEKIKLLKEKWATSIRVAQEKFTEKTPEYEGGKFTILDHWRLHGHKDALYEIWKNYCRLYNLTAEHPVLTEQVFDKIVDTINYLAMLAGILALYGDEAPTSNTKGRK